MIGISESTIPAARLEQIRQEMLNKRVAESGHMMDKDDIQVLERQQYRMVGHHSAVKVCTWTKNMIKKKGGCYKFVFYGIRSHQCMQMTTSMFCANRCTFCWRGAKAPVSKSWYGPIDQPAEIIDGALGAHKGLLYGFKGNDKVSKRAYEESDRVSHVALSLTGEPISYPLINEICHEFHQRKISTFIVTNAQFPEQIEKVQYVTQLYLSIDAPTKELLKEIDRPLFEDYFERMLQSLDIIARKPYRTCIRLTHIKGVNDFQIKEYAQLINRGKPKIIEIKSYMHVGASREFLTRDHQPSMEDVERFTKQILEALPDYEYVNSHQPSRVTCLIRKDMQGRNYIDFPKFFAMAAAKEVPVAFDYSSKTMTPNR